MVLTQMTDINDIRLTNARDLASTYCTSLAKFADRVDRAPTQISRIMGKNPTKNIGDKMARHIEKSFNKESGWLDQIHTANTQPTTGVQEQPALYMALTEESNQLELLRSVIETVELIELEEGLKLTPSEKAQTIIACLKTCMKRGHNHSASPAVVTAAIQAII